MQTQKQCSFYAVNSCKKGINCPFAHGQASLPRSVCLHYRAGSCMFGERCRNIHERLGAETLHYPHVSEAQLDPTPQRRNVPSTPIPHKTATCVFWKANQCTAGDQCKFLHDHLPSGGPRATPTVFGRKLGSRPEDLVGTQTKEKHTDITGGRPPERSDVQVRSDSRNASSLPNRSEDQEPAEAVSSSKAMIEKLFSDRTRARIGPGGEITKVLTAFESHRVTLSNLSDETSQEELISVAEGFGPLKSVDLAPPAPGTKRKAEVEFLDPDSAKTAAMALDGFELRTRRLVAQLNLRSAETAAADLRSSTLKMSWFAPSRLAYAHYDSFFEASCKASELNGKVCAARKVSTVFQQPTPRQTCNFTVIIKGLPPFTPLDELKRFCGSMSVKIGNASYYGKEGTVRVRERLEYFGPLDSFDLSHPMPGDLKIKALVRYVKPEHATAAYKQLQGQSQPFLGGAKTWLTLLHSVKYNIPKAQFVVLNDSLCGLQAEDDNNSAKVRVYNKDEAGRPVDPVCVRIYGDDPKTLGVLKTKIEKLLSGEEITHEGASEFIRWKGSQQYVELIHSESGAYIRRDTRRRKLHVSGSHQQRDRARELLLNKIEELRTQRHIIQLSKDVLGKLLQGGLAHLQGALGEDALSLDVRNRSLTVRGDDEAIQVARLSLKALAADVPVPAAGDDADCPVCFCEVTNPVKLACGHSYCYACLRHYLGSAENFPVKCLSEDGRCDSPIPLSAIIDILGSDEAKFFDTAFLAFIHQHPTDFRHCPTPDCTTIYRPGEPGQILRCPSCLARICPSCHVEFHEGLTCAEQRYSQSDGELAFQKWKDAHNVQACPNCNADIEKRDGCNHITCAHCHTHMCWVCRTTSPNGKGIYDHMGAAHGGIGIEPVEGGGFI